MLDLEKKLKRLPHAPKAETYREAHLVYSTLGWEGVLPLPPRAKQDPPKGYTGNNGIYPSMADRWDWGENMPADSNTALRMPDGVIGIDVDAYEGKPGGETLAKAESRWGALPETLRSSSRFNDSVSGIRFYRVPKGTRLRDEIKLDGKAGIEIIQRHHRYAVVWPSRHPSGGYYMWFGRDGQTFPPPAVDSLPDLPQAWIDELSVDQPAPDADPAAVAAVTIDVLTEGEPSAAVRRRLDTTIEQLTGGGSRHDAVRNNVLALLRLGQNGHPGVRHAIEELEAAFVAQPGKTAYEYNAFIYENPKDPSKGLNVRVKQELAQPSTAEPYVPPPTEPPPDDDWHHPADTTPEQDSGEGDEGGGGPSEDDQPVIIHRTREEQAATLTRACEVFAKWLGPEYDRDAMLTLLAALAAHRMGGDPVWLLIVSGSGAAKTETVNSAHTMHGAHTISTITSEGALLSASSKKDRAKDASGGLLNEIGDDGIIIVKDFTSILSMNRDARAAVMAALREIYDGAWVRKVGTDGGKSLEWRGRVTVAGAVTTAWDAAHSVIASMGDRFVLKRIDSNINRVAFGARAIGNTGNEAAMRAELGAAVADVMAAIAKGHSRIELTEEELYTLLHAADLVTRARTAVEYDYRGQPDMAHAPEAPTRFAKQLAQIFCGAVAVGVDREASLRLAVDCARDSMPPIRLQIIDYVAAHPASTTADVTRGIDQPRTTVDRQLQSLHLLGVLTVDAVEDAMAGNFGRPDRRVTWYYSLAPGIDPAALSTTPQNMSPDMETYA